MQRLFITALACLISVYGQIERIENTATQEIGRLDNILGVMKIVKYDRENSD